ncbi:hypothetical protein GQ457_05G028000 [Hibiscus cannabinus]
MLQYLCAHHPSLNAAASLPSQSLQLLTCTHHQQHLLKQHQPFKSNKAGKQHPCNNASYMLLLYKKWAWNKSTRERHEPERYGFLVTTHGDVIIVDQDEPKTYKEALSSSDSEKWLEAMRSEMDSMSENQVWTLVEPPEGVKPIGCKWVFKKKTDMDAMFKSIRILLDVAAFDDYEIWQMDVKTAFLNGKLEEDVYMTQLKGFVTLENAGKVLADSTTEAEYIAASEIAKEAVWIKKFITGLGVIPSISDVVDLYCDNNGAIAQAKEPRSHQRSKHILRRFHLIREIIDRGDVEICKVHTDDNIDDPLTKPLAQQKHDCHTESLCIRYVSDWS